MIIAELAVTVMLHLYAALTEKVRVGLKLTESAWRQIGPGRETRYCGKDDIQPADRPAATVGVPVVSSVALYARPLMVAITFAK